MTLAEALYVRPSEVSVFKILHMSNLSLFHATQLSCTRYLAASFSILRSASFVRECLCSWAVLSKDGFDAMCNIPCFAAAVDFVLAEWVAQLETLSLPQSCRS